MGTADSTTQSLCPCMHLSKLHQRGMNMGRMVAVHRSYHNTSFYCATQQGGQTAKLGIQIAREPHTAAETISPYLGLISAVYSEFPAVSGTCIFIHTQHMGCLPSATPGLTA